jgi:hypothetical protein
LTLSVPCLSHPPQRLQISASVDRGDRNYRIYRQIFRLFSGKLPHEPIIIEDHIYDLMDCAHFKFGGKRIADVASRT